MEICGIHAKPCGGISWKSVVYKTSLILIYETTMTLGEIDNEFGTRMDLAQDRVP
jgi:hypothetical protein